MHALFGLEPGVSPASTTTSSRWWIPAIVRDWHWGLLLAWTNARNPAASFGSSILAPQRCVSSKCVSKSALMQRTSAVVLKHWNRTKGGGLAICMNQTYLASVRSPNRSGSSSTWLKCKVHNWISISQPKNLQQLCQVLNEFALPRAIVDFERHSFVAWNPRILEPYGLFPRRNETSKAEELLTFDASWFPLSDEREGQTVEYIACLARRPFGAGPAPGFAVRSHGKR